MTNKTSIRISINNDLIITSFKTAQQSTNSLKLFPPKGPLEKEKKNLFNSFQKADSKKVNLAFYF